MGADISATVMKCLSFHAKKKQEKVRLVKLHATGG
jgi:hypothetical protein